jgi:hypothetical protein
LQVLKGRLSLLAPSVRCGTFNYEEGEGLEEDEVRVCPASTVAIKQALLCATLSHDVCCQADAPLQVALNQALLPRVLAKLPSGGVVHNSILDIDDQEQCFKAQLVIHHRASSCGLPRPYGWCLVYLAKR